MGLATGDPHSHKIQTKLYKIPKFGVNRPKSKQDIQPLKMSKFTKKCMAIRTLSDTASGCRTFLCFKILTFLRTFAPIATAHAIH